MYGGWLLVGGLAGKRPGGHESGLGSPGDLFVAPNRDNPVGSPRSRLGRQVANDQLLELGVVRAPLPASKYAAMTGQ